jgi:hypothetical protein
MPILGIIASQNYSRVTNSYESISTVTVGSGGTAQIDFTSIPATYTHLQLRFTAATDRSAFVVDLPVMQVGNGSIDTGNNYSCHNVAFRADSVMASDNYPNAPYMYFMYAASSALVSNTYGVGVIDLLDYANTNKYKTFRALSGCDLNGTPGGGGSIGGALSFVSGNWRSTSAITNIRLTPVIGPNFTQYSSFALYGIKGA